MGIIVYSLLYTDINFNIEESGAKTAMAAKFFLIPVALSMQTDLMNSFFLLANLSYSQEVLKVSTSATKPKLFLSFLLRFLDGLFSLAVNFKLMMIQDEVLSILQDIDDIFYGLVELGFFGDGMEHWSTVCKSISLPPRTGADNKFCGAFRMSHLDSGLWLICFIALLIYYFYVFWGVNFLFDGFQTV